MRSDRSTARPSNPAQPSAPTARSGRRRSPDEPALRPDARTPPQADVAGVESAAGEEDPGAALDTPTTKRSS